MSTCKQTGPAKRRDPAQIDRLVNTLRSRHVPTARDRLVRLELDRLLRRDENGALMPEPVRFTGGAETRGIVVTDEPGGGKTTVLRHVLANHPALGPAAGPARYLTVPVFSPATLKSFGCEILRRTSYEDISERRERWSIWRLVQHRLSALGIVCLMIDEAHDLRSSGSMLEANDILKAFKSIMSGDPPVILILSGVPVLHELLDLSGQTGRRFARVEFPPVTDATEGKQLRKLVVDYCQIAELRPPTEDVVTRLIFAMRGRFGLCVEGIVNAIENALDEGAGELGPMHFARSWATTFGRGVDGNPFLGRDWARLDLEPGRNPKILKKVF